MPFVQLSKTLTLTFLRKRISRGACLRQTPLLLEYHSRRYSTSPKLNSRNCCILDVKPRTRCGVRQVTYLLCATYMAQSSHFCYPHTVVFPYRSDYCIPVSRALSLSLSRSPKGSASLAFQRSSQSDK